MITLSGFFATTIITSVVKPVLIDMAKGKFKIYLEKPPSKEDEKMDNPVRSNEGDEEGGSNDHHTEDS